jgi:V-type H+-transporting ATPase subunit E
LDEKFTLQEATVEEGAAEKTSKGDENIKCFGGVILTSEDGLIVCKNTLDSRIDLAYQHMLPSIREHLFM